MPDKDEIRQAIGVLILDQATHLSKLGGLISADAAQAIQTLAEAFYQLEPSQVDE